MGKGYSNLAVATAAASSIIFGYQLAILNTTSQFLTLRFEACGDHYTYACDAAFSSEALAVTAVVVGATVGCFPAGPVVGVSRRLAFMITHILGIAAGISTMFVTNYTQLAAARFLTGLCVGFVCVVSPTWISEFSPAKKRGKNGVFHQLAVVIGIAIANFVGKLLTPPPADPTPEYRMSPWDRSFSMVLISGAPAVYSAVILLVIFVLLHDDSPQIYVQKNDVSRARVVLEKINDTPEEAEETLRTLKDELQGSGNDESRSQEGFFALLQKPNYMYCLVIGIILSLGQQLGGINAFVAQSSTIFREAGLSPEACVNMSIAMSVINFVMTFPAMFAIDRFGRKPLLLIGLFGQTVFLSLPVLCWVFGRDYSMAAVVAVIGYVACFAFSYGPVLWVYLFEMFPSDMKGSAAGVCSGANWAANSVVVYLNRRYASYVLTNFGVFAISCALLLVFNAVYLKETKGATGCPYLDKANKLDESRPLFADNA